MVELRQALTVISVLSPLHHGLLVNCLRVRGLNIPFSASLIYRTQSEVVHMQVNARKRLS
jgi:hypothetical protein